MHGEHDATEPERWVADDATLPPRTVAQFRWLVAALRDEAHAESHEHRASFAARLEQALAGAEQEISSRIGASVTGRDAGLLVVLARWHEDVAGALEESPERAGHRGRARRYRDISQIMRLWV